MTVKMILAVDQDNAIGWSDGRLPWKIPADMKRFKELTTNHDVLMGRKTFESLGRPQGLPNRHNIVVTKSIDGLDDSIFLVNAFELFVRAHQDHSDYYPVQRDLWIIGGATIYNQAIELQFVDEIYLTLVGDNSGADIKLQNDFTNWKLFVLHQAKVGVQWNLDYLGTPAKTDTGLSYTFIILKKTTHS